MKIEYLNNRNNGRAFTGATATPIANSISEAYGVQRYLLLEAGIPDLDTWAGTFRVRRYEDAKRFATEAADAGRDSYNSAQTAIVQAIVDRVRAERGLPLVAVSDK